MHWLAVLLMLNTKTTVAGLFAGDVLMLNDKTRLLARGCVNVE
jgi:hypothetical protein